VVLETGVRLDNAWEGIHGIVLELINRGGLGIPSYWTLNRGMELEFGYAKLVSLSEVGIYG
jgi:hypothetical protein